MKMTRQLQYYVCLLAGSLFLFVSCLWQEENLFDKSSAQRLNESLANSKKILTAAPDGWCMEYFATSTSGGYSLLVKFDSDGTATVGARNEYFPAFTTDTCSFDVIGDSGPVLTFNTFNRIIHQFSNPENPVGKGLEGDYEFIIMEASDDHLLMKGKKRGTSILMKRLDAGQSWPAYADKLIGMNDSLFSQSVKSLVFKAGDAEYVAYDPTSHVFSLLKKGADEITGERTKVPFIVTLTGIRLQKPFPVQIGNQTIEVSRFNYKSETQALVAEETEAAYIKGPHPGLFFADSLNWIGNTNWKMDNNQLGGRFKSVHARIVESCKQNLKKDFGYFFFSYQARRKSRTLSCQAAGAVGSTDFNASGMSESQAVLSYKGTMDNNAKVFYSRLDGFPEMIELLNNAFVVTTDYPLRPTVLKLTSAANPEDWFQVSLE